MYVPECPGAEALDGLLGPLLAARPGIQVTWQVVKTEDEAARLGMTGSPTILADGRDLFPTPGQQPCLSSILSPQARAVGSGARRRAPQEALSRRRAPMTSGRCREYGRRSLNPGRGQPLPRMVM